MRSLTESLPVTGAQSQQPSVLRKGIEDCTGAAVPVERAPASRAVRVDPVATGVVVQHDHEVPVAARLFSGRHELASRSLVGSAAQVPADVVVSTGSFGSRSNHSGEKGNDSSVAALTQRLCSSR